MWCSERELIERSLRTHLQPGEAAVRGGEARLQEAGAARPAPGSDAGAGHTRPGAQLQGSKPGYAPDRLDHCRDLSRVTDIGYARGLKNSLQLQKRRESRKDWCHHNNRACQDWYRCTSR